MVPFNEQKSAKKTKTENLKSWTPLERNCRYVPTVNAINPFIQTSAPYVYQHAFVVVRASGYCHYRSFAAADTSGCLFVFNVGIIPRTAEGALKINNARDRDADSGKPRHRACTRRPQVVKRLRQLLEFRTGRGRFEVFIAAHSPVRVTIVFRKAITIITSDAVYTNDRGNYFVSAPRAVCFLCERVVFIFVLKNTCIFCFSFATYTTIKTIPFPIGIRVKQ